jgi:hypothetical protein
MMKISTLRYKLVCAFFLFLFTITACKKIEDLLTFTVSNDCSVTINAWTPLTIPLDLTTPAVETNSSAQFKNNNSDASLVKDIRLSQLTLTITSPSGKTFSFLQSVKIYISSSSSDEIELAYLDNVPSNATSIQLIPTTAKLDAYVKASSYSLRTEVVTKETLNQNVDIDVFSKFKVTANL